MQSMPALSFDVDLTGRNNRQNEIDGIISSLKMSEKLTNNEIETDALHLYLTYLHCQAAANHLRHLRGLDTSLYPISTNRHGKFPKNLVMRQSKQTTPLQTRSHLKNLDDQIYKIAKKLRQFSGLLGYQLPFVEEQQVEALLSEVAAIHD